MQPRRDAAVVNLDRNALRDERIELDLDDLGIEVKNLDTGVGGLHVDLNGRERGTRVGGCRRQVDGGGEARAG